MNNESSEYIKNLELTIEKLKKENQILHEEIEILKKDPLTQTYTRRYLDELIEEEYLPKLKNRKNWFYNIYLLDLNNLHDINRKQGFEAGDKYIKNSITYVKNIFDKFNASYRIFRLGGDEFIVISQPYDHISLDLLENPNYEIVKTEWNNTLSFKEVIKKLDSELINKKNKKNKNKIFICRSCILKKYPEIYDIAMEYLNNQKSKNDS